MYIGELTKKENTGKTSPGPAYVYKDEIKFETVSLFILFIIPFY